MNTIIHEIIEKITRDFNNNIEDLMLNNRDISRFIINTKKSLDEIGAMIVKEAIETSYEKSGKRASSNV